MYNILDAYRFINNYVEIHISGGFTERFLNLCNREEIHLWDSMFENNGMRVKIYCKDFVRLKEIRRKSGVKIKILNKNGLYFKAIKYKKRKMLVCGVAASLLLMIIFNQFIWSLEVKGADTIGTDRILAVCDDLGIKFGALVVAIDEGETGRELVNRFDGELLWSAVNTKGSKTTIEIKERSAKNKESADTQPCNIVADFEGIVLSAETYSGELKTSRGSAVKSGDLLISGISENNDGSVNFHHADGKLTALHNKIVTFNTVTTDNAYKIEDYTINSAVKLFSLNIPLFLNMLKSQENELIYTELIKIRNSLLPFGIQKSCDLILSDKPVNNSSILYTVDKFTEDEYCTMKKTLITDAVYETETKNNNLYITATYSCIDFIGEKKIILKEN